jgi:hypothetical protein
MTNAPKSIDDPLKLVESLNPQAIEAKIDELDRQQRALRVLLRSAKARQRRQHAMPEQEANLAS